MDYKHLPHINIENHYQFVTFRTSDSVDGYLQKLTRDAGSNSRKQLAIDDYLDQSPLGAHLNSEILFVLFDYLHSKKGKFYKLAAFCIMPNHVHLLIKPLEDLAVVMKMIKGNTARSINQLLNLHGSFWAPDYFDRLIRNEQHFRIAYDYIKNNPLKLEESINASQRFYGIYG